MHELMRIIPADEVEWVKIYIADCRETLAEVRRKTGADYVINGGLYDMASGKPVCHLKADGYVYAADRYTYWGYGWSKGGLPELVSDYSGLDNYICCNCLVRGGQAVKLYYNADQGGARPRTAMGRMPDGALMLYCSTEGKTPEGLQQELLALGVDSALMLDGGGSVQCDMAGRVITSARQVHNYICVKVRARKMKIYRVQVGAFSVREIAERLRAELQGKGYEAFIAERGTDDEDDVEEDSMLRVIEPDYSWNGELKKRTSTKYIILHHAAVSEASAENIHREHLGRRWIGIGYNYYIRKDGTIYRGRPEDCVGAHTYGYNAVSIGICFEGNFENETMGSAQYNAGVALLRDILSRYPDLLIRGHKNFDATACPGRNFPMEPMKEDAEGAGRHDSRPLQEDKEGVAMERVYARLEDVPEWGRETVRKLVDRQAIQGVSGGTLNINETMLRVLVIHDRMGLYD